MRGWYTPYMEHTPTNGGNGMDSPPLTAQQCYYLASLKGFAYQVGIHTVTTDGDMTVRWRSDRATHETTVARDGYITSRVLLRDH